MKSFYSKSSFFDLECYNSHPMICKETNKKLFLNLVFRKYSMEPIFRFKPYSASQTFFWPRITSIGVITWFMTLIDCNEKCNVKFFLVTDHLWFTKSGLRSIALQSNSGLILLKGFFCWKRYFKKSKIWFCN